MQLFACPYLHAEVELTDERSAHITETHPDLMPEFIEQIGQALYEPDEVKRSVRSNGARLFSAGLIMCLMASTLQSS